MPRTFFQDFARDDGSPVTVEYAFAPGSETTYSPMHGACGGDACELEIVDAWPNTPRYDWWVRLAGWGYRSNRIQRVIGSFVDCGLDFVTAVWWCRLTVAERERMEAWLADHHVDEPDDD